MKQLLLHVVVGFWSAPAEYPPRAFWSAPAEYPPRADAHHVGLPVPERQRPPAAGEYATVELRWPGPAE